MFNKATLIKVAKVLAMAILVVVVIIVAFALVPKTVKDKTVSGLHWRPEKWSGTITITGDTRFMPWVGLTIAPGTHVLFQKKADLPGTDWTQFADAYIKDHNDPTGRRGYNQSHFDLSARIKAVGTKDSPIVFSSAQAKPEYADWDQLVLFGGSQLDYVELSYAHNGVYVGNDAVPLFNHQKVTIANSTIHDSLWSCIDIWSLDASLTNNQIYHCWHQGVGVKKASQDVIDGNNIHDAQLSINCEQAAKPTITNNHFTAAPLSPDCPTGSGNANQDRTADTPGGTYGSQLIYPSNAQ